MKFLQLLCVSALSFNLCHADNEAPFSMADYAHVEKIDMHFHLSAWENDFVERAEADHFRLMNIVVDSAGPLMTRQRHRATFLLKDAHPETIAAAATFSMEGWDEPDWTEKTLRHLDDAIAKGAVAVKVWKNIGMAFRDKAGKLVMIDNPQFDPIFKHLQEKGIRVIGHLGEPKNCWLPLDEMTVKNDRNYFDNNPQYHMFLHPEMPSYEEQIAARDRMLAKHPDLVFIGAHFGSLEWSVDALSQFLDRFPNASVDMAARIGQLQYQSTQDRDKVIAFLNKYQDRVLYGTDFTMAADASAESAYISAHQRWLDHWRYFNTDETFTVPELDVPVKGLALPKSIVTKLYRENAAKLFPKAWKRAAK